MNQDAVRWLAQEVRDLLDASSVGLYEFIWLQRGEKPDLEREQAVQLAEAALADLLTDDALKLVYLKWPGEVPVRELRPADVSPDSWNDPTDDGYVALVRA